MRSYEELGSFLPATYTDLAASGEELDQATFKSSCGSWHRIDFVAVSEDCIVLNDSAMVLREAQCALPSDHSMTVAKVIFPLHKSFHAQRRRQVGYDRTCARGSPAARDKFAKLVEEIAPIAENTDSSTHCYSTMTAIRSAAAVAFPKTRSAAKGYQLSEVTQEAMCVARKTLRWVGWYGREMRLRAVRACFAIWSSSGSWEWYQMTGFVTSSFARSWAMACVEQRRCAFQAKSWFRMEQAAHYAAFGDRLASALSGANWEGLQKVVAELKPKRAPPSCRVSCGGGPAKSYAEERGAFVEHYGRLFEGDVTTFGEILEAERRHFATARDAEDMAPPPEALPTLHSTVWLIMRSPQKAVGEDLTGAEIFNTNPQLPAKAWLPIACKAVLGRRCCEK